MGICKKIKKLYIRADGNADIGLGHIMRTMTIANEFRKNGFECMYLSSAPINKEIFDKYNYKVMELPYAYNDKTMDEANQIARLLDYNNVDYILVDSYYLNNEYLNKLREYTIVVCINSTRKQLATDFLINENIACDKSYFSKLYSNSDTILLLGEEYSPLRDEFINKVYSINPVVSRVLVTTGGGDQSNFMTTFLKKIKSYKEFDNINFTFVSGGCNTYYNELKSEADKYSNVTVVNSTFNMSELMQKSDIAITAGGTTVLELSAIGVPTIGIAVADDQEAGLNYMGNVGMIKYAGRLLNDNFWSSLLLEFYGLLENYTDRKILYTNSKKYIDGNGARRIYNHIIEQDNVIISRKK